MTKPPVTAKPRHPESRWYRRIFQDSPEPSWIVDSASLRILDANRRAEEISGFTREEFMERTLVELVQPWAPDSFGAALYSGDFSSPEFRGVTVFTRSGQPVEVDLLIRRTVYGGSEALMIVLADAAARTQLEQQLRQARKMESVGMLAGGIAHDFNNLLTIIAGYGHMLAADLSKDPKNRSAAEQITKASDRAAALTRQLLSFSRPQLLQVKVLDLNAVVQGMTPMLRRIIGENIDLRFSPAEGLDCVHADSGQVEQVIMNLVVNARDAMPSGGKLLIDTRNTELSESYAGKHLEVRPGRYVMLAVTDTGVGMSKETREKVFEPFFTTKEPGQGTGLGLSMVMGIVKRAGGTVDVYSEQGTGTAVKIYLPRADTSIAAPANAAGLQAGGGWETVLVVEDDEPVRKLVQTTLQGRGYEVLTAGNGAEALHASKEHSGPIQLLITDLVMPDMNGRDVARKLHRQRTKMAVLFMSGYTDATLHHTETPDRVLHFLGKPFTPEMLTRKVREVLDENKRSVDQQRHARS